MGVPYFLLLFTLTYGPCETQSRKRTKGCNIENTKEENIPCDFLILKRSNRLGYR